MKQLLILTIVLASSASFAKKQEGIENFLMACADDKNRATTVEKTIVNGGTEYVATVQLGAAVQVQRQPIARIFSIAEQVTFKGEALEITFPMEQPAYIAPAYTHAEGTIKVAGFDDKEVKLFCWRGPLFKDTLPR